MKDISMKIALVIVFTTISFTPIPTNKVAQELNVITPQVELVDSTAYYDKYDCGHGADGRSLVEGLTLAGKREWLGMSAMLYDTDMNFIGIYEFRDTGYGQSTGKGQSKLLKNKSIGTIENGTCIDVYFTNYSKCKEWGRRKVYMKLVKAVG